MKLKPGRFLDKTTTFSRRRRPAAAERRAGCRISGRVVLPLVLLAGVTGALAQGILAPSSADFEQSSLAPSLPGYQTGGAPPAGGAIPQTQGPVQLGPVDVHPHFDYQFIYGDGIPATPTNHVTTAIQEVSPGVLLKIGSHWTLDYTATMIFYSNPQFSDTTSQNVMLNGFTQYEDWTFRLSQGYSYSDTPQVQTDAQTEQTAYATALMASRALGGHLSAQCSLNQVISSSSEDRGSTANSSQDVESWVLSGGLNYQTEFHLGVGINGAAGYEAVTPGGDMKFEQLQGTLNWQPAAKLSAVASCGAQETQMMGTQFVEPTFSLAINYQPFEKTSLSLIGSRTVSPSVFQDEVIVATSLSATFRQQFLQHYNFEVSGGYATTPYLGFATAADIAGVRQLGAPLPVLAAAFGQSRTDYSRSLRVSVGSAFRQRGTVSIFYCYTDTTSGLSAFALTSNQVGLEVGWRY